MSRQSTSLELYTPSDHDRKYAESQIELARLQAATYLPQLLEVMVDRALDPQAKSKDILDASEFTYKVSGLAKRQEEVKNTPSFQVRIVLPGQNREITIGGATPQPEPPRSDESDILDVVPEHVKSMKPKRSPRTKTSNADLITHPERPVEEPTSVLVPHQRLDDHVEAAINDLNFDDID